jgi:hypothetical protein
VSAPGDRYQRLLRLHPAGPEKDDLLATLLQLAEERGRPTRREILGVALLVLRRRLRAQAVAAVAAAVAVLLVAGGVALVLGPAGRTAAEIRCDRQGPNVWQAQQRLAESVFPHGAYDSYGMGGDCREATRNLDMYLYLVPGWHRAKAEAALREQRWMLVRSTSVSSLWWNDGFSVEVRDPDAGVWVRQAVVTIHKT